MTMGLMIRDPRSGRTGGRRSAPARGAVRVTPPAPPSWPRLSMPSWQGAGQRLQQWLWPLLLVILGMGLYELYHRLQPLAQHPISTINVEGDLQYIDRDSVQQIIAPYMDESLVTIDLEQLRADLLGMPWVAGATVTRIWPDRLVINLDEHLPIARWGERPAEQCRAGVQPGADRPLPGAAAAQRPRTCQTAGDADLPAVQSAAAALRARSGAAGNARPR